MRRTEQLLTRQFRRYEIDRELLRSFERDEAAGKSPCPVLTISRELGSGGMSIGKIVANELKFAYFDKTIIEQVAEQVGSDEGHIAKYEVEQHGQFTGLLMNLLDSRNVTQAVYLRTLLKVLRKIGEQGRAVIIGRGGACVLPESVRVRVIAPFDLRVHRMQELRNTDRKTAEQEVLASDHARRRFLRSFFGCNVDDCHLYDLVINTASLSLDHAADLIVTRVRQSWKEG